MKKILILVKICSFSLCIHAQHIAKRLEHHLILCEKEKINECFVEENNYFQLEIYDHFDSIQRHIRVFNLKDASIQDLEYIKLAYKLIDSIYTDYWITSYRPPFPDLISYYDWANFYFTFEEAIRYLELKHNKTTVSFEFLKNMIQGIKNRDSVMMSQYLDGIQNEKVFGEGGIFYRHSISSYYMYCLHNAEQFEDAIINEMRMFQPQSEKTNEDRMFYIWRNVLWNTGRSDLLKQIITSKKDAYEAVGRLKIWEELMTWL